MGKIIGVSTAINFAEQRLALKWAEEHLSEDQYLEIQTSYNKLFKRTTLFIVLCCIPIMIVLLFLAFRTPFSISMENQSMPGDATHYVMAKVDYDGNFYWTSDSKIYEYSLKEYGLAPEKYEFGNEVKVYIDDEQNIIKVSEIEKSVNMKQIEFGVGIIGSILVPALLIMCVYYPLARRTFGKNWFKFYKEFNGK